MAQLASDAPSSIVSAFPAPSHWPAEILIQIFSHFGRRPCLLVFALVCRRWHDLVVDSIVSLPAAAPPHVYAHFPNLMDLEMKWEGDPPEQSTHSIGESNTSMLYQLPLRLTSLKVLNRSTSCICALLTGVSSLLSLTCDLSCDCSEAVLGNNSSLTSLTPRGEVGSPVELPRLRSLTVHTDDVELLDMHATQLTSLVWLDYYNGVPLAMPNLRSLHVNALTDSGDPAPGIRRLLALSPSLTSIALDIYETDLTTQQLITLIGQCKSILTSINVQQRGPQSPIFKKLVQCPSLTSLEATFSREPNHLEIKYLPILFPRLLSFACTSYSYFPALALIRHATRLTSMRLTRPLFEPLAKGEWPFTRLRHLHLDPPKTEFLERVLARTPALRTMLVEYHEKSPDPLALTAMLRAVEKSGVQEITLRIFRTWTAQQRAEVTSKFRWLRIVWRP